MANRHMTLAYRSFLLSLFLCISTAGAAEEGKLLWEIGTPDNNYAEFANAGQVSAPWDWNRDVLFAIGESDSHKDWPYVQPGPSDAWAGSRTHTCRILFGLKSAPAEGQCALEVRLIDTHYAGPPRLRITINGTEFERAMPKGASDESAQGHPEKGKHHRFDVRFPSSLLRQGDNEIQITSLSGSWMLYDWLGLKTPSASQLTRLQTATALIKAEPIPALLERDGKLFQPVSLVLRHVGGPQKVVLKLAGAADTELELTGGVQTAEMLVPAVEKPTELRLEIKAEGEQVPPATVTLKPVRKLTLYILPHSHTDIGYTEIQTAIEKKQVNNLLEGIAAARRTASYPEGSRFVWNVEVLWAADLYWHRLSKEQRVEFLDAVKRGQVVLNGMYLNELTGLCRPEELVQLFRTATEMSQFTGVPIESAMISDVPGYTWGLVSAMNSAGIKYFSAAPNYFDRIGTILREWENKPFYWVGPDGKSKVLTWIPYKGYAMSHIFNQLREDRIVEIMNTLDAQKYPYDIAYVRWAGHGDNADPDPAICDDVRAWNSRYAWPHLIIAGVPEAFRAFEKRYGSQLPKVRGDWTPYWEDGAGSSALETSMNRQSSDRLDQAATLFALRSPASYPATEFDDAWKKVLLYSEHTWGADCSISKPESQKTREQWEIKKGYADAADSQSRALVAQSLGGLPSPNADTIEVVNTLSWPRTDLVTLSAAAGDSVLDDSGKPVPAQKLTTGGLVFLASDVPAFGSRRYRVTTGAACSSGSPATASADVLENGKIRARVDAVTGAIVELSAAGLDGNFADTSGGEALNDYRYLIGDDLRDLQRNGPVKVKVLENGPLLASLLVESDAPGCKHLAREIRLAAGRDYLEIFDIVDKARLDASDYHARNGKESLNFAFPFNVPDGQIRVDLPLAQMRPDVDQIPGACKNWVTVGRFIDVSNRRRGITWVTLDAPLAELGGITAILLNSQTNPDVWRKSIGRTQRVYSWAMNNHWGTNYRAYQEGPTVFRFILRPHRGHDMAEASRFATGFSYPLVVAKPSAPRNAMPGPLKVEPDDALVTALKPADDGQGWIVRLYGASDSKRKAKITLNGKTPAMSLTDTSEVHGNSIRGRIPVPSHGLVSVRIQPGADQ